jgi:hypothetical protein
MQALDRRSRWRARIARIAALSSVTLLGATSAWAQNDDRSELATLQTLAPTLASDVLADALHAVRCLAPRDGTPASSRFLIVDYALPSTVPRAWLFDLSRPELLLHELVAHGRGSGENLATTFSNADGSDASSLGLYRAGEVYQGKNGLSLRLDGLTPGWNDAARRRLIVIHGAWYVNAEFARANGRLGRSWGCPAFAPDVAPRVIAALRDGGWVYISANTPDWHAHAHAAACKPPASAPAPAESPRRTPAAFR